MKEEKYHALMHSSLLTMQPSRGGPHEMGRPLMLVKGTLNDLIYLSEPFRQKGHLKSRGEICELNLDVGSNYLAWMVQLITGLL